MLGQQGREKLQSLNFRLSSYIPHKPTPKQLAFLLTEAEEAMYGGAAGGGKSDALLMGALQYVDQPGYASLILRRSYADLSKSEALIPRSLEWLGAREAHWNSGQKVWTFPSGSTMEFGYLARDLDVYQYASAAYQYIGFDEVTQFQEFQYKFMFSRLRRPKGSTIPLRMRSASNPGGIGHEWVKERFLDKGLEMGRVFIPALLQDNPYLDQESYIRSLGNLDPITLKRLLEGD